jgi:hypothetical protein
MRSAPRAPPLHNIHKESNMPSYTVRTPIRKDGEDYAPGEKIDLSEKQAAAIAHAVEPARESKASASAAAGAGVDVNKMTKQQIVDFAKDKLGLTLDVNSTKEELIAAISAK